MEKNLQELIGQGSTEPQMWFVVRDTLGDDVGPAKYTNFDEAERALRLFCESSRNELSDVDGAMLGVVYQDGERDYQFGLVRNASNGYLNEFRSLHDNIPEEAMDVPEIAWAALKGELAANPFDDWVQRRIDSLEQSLGLHERGMDLPGDLYVGNWRVHLVPPVEPDRVHHAAHDGMSSMVEFYDMRADSGRFPEGQCVGAFAVEDLLSNRFGSSPEQLMEDGLSLSADNQDAMRLSGAEMCQVFDWFKYRELQAGEPCQEVHLSVDIYGYAFEAAEINVVWALEQIALARDVACVGLRELPYERPKIQGQPALAGVQVDAVFWTQADAASVEQEIHKCFEETYTSFKAKPYGITCEMKQVGQVEKSLSEKLEDAQKQSVSGIHSGKQDVEKELF